MATEERRLLESWKEISVYLNRSVRTCCRWEASLGLPVHRLDGTPSARVFAYADELDRWLQEKLHHVEEEAKHEAARRARGWKRLVLGAAVLAVAAGAVTLIWHPFSPVPAPVTSPNPSLAILPFENSTGELNLSAWRTALPDLAVTDLIQSRFVNVVKITNTLRELVELELTDAERFSDADLKAVAEKLDAEYVATGTLTRDGPDKVVTVLVRSPSAPTPIAGRPVRVSFRDEKDVFAAVDALTLQIKRSIGLRGRHVSRDIDRPVSEISTVSPQAFKLFSQGFRLGGLSKWQEAIALLERAVELDPEFALAYKYLSLGCMASNRPDDGAAFLRKTTELYARLSERERSEFEVRWGPRLGKSEGEQLAAMERMVRTYPEDRFGSSRLMAYYLGHEEWDTALPVAERAWSANRSDNLLCYGLTLCYSNLGQWEKAEAVRRGFIERNPGHPDLPGAVSERAQILTRLGRFDEALASVDRLIEEFPDSWPYSRIRGIVLLYKSDLAGAEHEFRKGLTSQDPSTRIDALQFLASLCLLRGRIAEASRQTRLAFEIVSGAAKGDQLVAHAGPDLHWVSAYLYRIAGRPAQALDEIEEARREYESLSWTESALWEVLFMRAKLLLDLDRPRDFELQVEEIRQDLEKKRTPRLMRVYEHLLGLNEMMKGDYQKAVAHLSRAVALAPLAGSRPFGGADPEYWYSLAQAQARLESGHPNDLAFSAYEKVVQPSTDWVDRGDVYARSLYEIAKCHDMIAGEPGLSTNSIADHRAKAIEKYREFLALWGGADPIFAPLVAEARARLAALELR